jgi:hypothetical protein
MRPHCLQFTVKGLMIAVAIVALTIGTTKMWLRATDFRRCADEHAEQESLWRDNEQLWLHHARATEHLIRDSHEDDEASRRKREELVMVAQSDRIMHESCAKLTIYHASMRQKYERAAARPWIKVEPDPSPPPTPIGAAFSLPVDDPTDREPDLPMPPG